MTTAIRPPFDVDASYWRTGLKITELASILAALPEEPAKRLAFIKKELAEKGFLKLEMIKGRRQEKYTVVITENKKANSRSNQDQLRIKLFIQEPSLSLKEASIKRFQESLITGNITKNELKRLTVGTPPNVTEAGRVDYSSKERKNIEPRSKEEKRAKKLHTPLSTYLTKRREFIEKLSSDTTN